MVDTLASFDRRFLSKGAQALLHQVKKFRDDALKEKRLLTFLFLNHIDEKKRMKILEKESVYGPSIQYKLADCVIGVGCTAVNDYYKYIKLLKTRMGVLPQSVSLVQSYQIDPNKDNLAFKYIGEYDEEILISNKTKNIDEALIKEIPTDSNSYTEKTIKYGNRRIPISIVAEMKILKTLREKSYGDIVKYMGTEYPQYNIKASSEVQRVIAKLDKYLKENDIDWDLLLQDFNSTHSQSDVSCMSQEDEEVPEWENEPEQINDVHDCTKIDLSNFVIDTQDTEVKKRKRIHTKKGSIIIKDVVEGSDRKE